MSYAISEALQTALFARLSGDPALTALVGAHVYDALPEGALPETYVTLGPEVVRDASDMGGRGAWHEVEVNVYSSAAGFRDAKRAAAAIGAALEAPGLTLGQGRLVALTFRKAEARHVRDGRRRIALRYRARVEAT
ncbi:DUF3168 domain-containing protein [Roseivivax sp.]